MSDSLKVRLRRLETVRNSRSTECWLHFEGREYAERPADGARLPIDEVRQRRNIILALIVYGKPARPTEDQEDEEEQDEGE